MTKQIQSQLVLKNEDAALHLLDQTMGYTYQAALRAVAQLGVADYLADGSKSVVDLAQAVGAEPQKLQRLLRVTATRDIFREVEPGVFELTPAADYLRTDADHSLRSAVLMLTDETFWRPIGELIESARGNPPFRHLYGKSFFEYWSQAGAQAEDFHVGMSSMSEVENIFLVRSYEFPDGATVADIAGGFGGLLLRVLQNNPSLHGILYDQPHVLERNRLGELADNSRWELSSGDFFKSAPKADIYLLKYIMHDWPDEQASLILKNIRKAMNPGARILIMDPLIPEGNTPHSGKLMDLLCMGIYEGGRERTKKEFEQLLASADMRLNRTIDTGCYVSIIEACAV
ncbi:methyltransferase [Pseudomonas paraversuta]|uniref:methyltransferase n=1 Tax=Pseudomonas paraversuta TaxID=2750624 RepID=UPI0019238166|nr:methyltransferase [Pseudomonas paraversuta]